MILHYIVRIDVNAADFQETLRILSDGMTKGWVKHYFWKAQHYHVENLFWNGKAALLAVIRVMTRIIFKHLSRGKVFMLTAVMARYSKMVNCNCRDIYTHSDRTSLREKILSDKLAWVTRTRTITWATHNQYSSSALFINLQVRWTNNIYIHSGN